MSLNAWRSQETKRKACDFPSGTSCLGMQRQIETFSSLHSFLTTAARRCRSTQQILRMQGRRHSATANHFNHQHQNQCLRTRPRAPRFSRATFLTRRKSTSAAHPKAFRIGSMSTILVLMRSKVQVKLYHRRSAHTKNNRISASRVSQHNRRGIRTAASTSSDILNTMRNPKRPVVDRADNPPDLYRHDNETSRTPLSRKMRRLSILPDSECRPLGRSHSLYLEANVKAPILLRPGHSHTLTVSCLAPTAVCPTTAA